MFKCNIRPTVSAAAVALSAALIAALPLNTYAIQPDAPFLRSQKKNKQKWARGDKQIDTKLAALRKRFGKRPNIIYILGGLYQQWFSYASGGKGSGEDVNFSWLNLFYFLNFEGGWQVGGTPVITADWEADSDNRWTVPIGLGVYKTHFFGKMPIKMGVEFQWMPVRPDTLGQVFNIRLTIAPVIPSFFK